MKLFCFRIREDQQKDLKKASLKTGAPVAELVRRALDEYIKEYDSKNNPPKIS